ncbi:MAG TPA: hypothetical protein DCF65_07750 [Chloroflexi bacterium]|nr:hypothetical protein [Chloroflexota bacterium]HAF21126.1 hypothetical protein [Chloroflexota bacterium]
MTVPPTSTDLRRPCGASASSPPALLAHAYHNAFAAVLVGSSHLHHLCTESLAAAGGSAMLA